MKEVSVLSFIVFFVYFFLGGALFSLALNRRQKALIYLTASFILRAILALGPSLIIYNVPLNWSVWITGPIKVSLIPLTFLFLEHLFSTERKFKARDLLHFVPFLLDFVLTICVAFYHAEEVVNRTPGQENLFGLSWQGNFYYTLLATTARAISLLQAVFYSAIILLRIRSQITLQKTEHSQLNEHFFWWTKGVYILYVFSGILEGAAILGIYQFASGFLAWVLFLLFNALYLFFYVVNFPPEKINQHQEFPTVPQKNKMPVPEETVEKRQEWLHNFITRELFLDAELSLQKTCIELNIPKHKLPQLIKNEGHPNFYSFVNHYRVEKSKVLLATLSSSQVVESVVSDAGFKSRSTFFRVFKETTGVTPGDYWRKTRQET